MAEMAKKKRQLWKKIIVLGISAGFFLAGGIVLWAATLEIPDLQSFETRKVEQSTKIYDRTGEVLLWDLHANIQRTVVPLDGISREIKNATVAIEDAEFYEHRGVKPTAIIRATLVNFLSLGFEQGGSTLTQQVVKNSLLTQEKLISRKIKEWVLALKLEKELSKEQILELYLNEVPYGGNFYGIEEASQAFFDKPAAEVGLAEAAYLAALPQAPTYYSPYGNNRDELERRKNLVLRRMLENGFITEAEFEDAQRAEVEFKPRQDAGIKAPHFVFFIREQLEQEYGRRALEERGFRVTTSLDWELQQKAQEIVERHARANEEKFNAENAALVATDPQTGEILVMVGSRDYFDPEIDGNFNIALAERQPGSAFKPFVYAAALKKGYTPETVVFDTHTQFSTSCGADTLNNQGTCYAPTNYDSTFRGPVTFREALAQSINVPAVKVLYLAGLRDALRIAKDLGISTLGDTNQYGLTLVLGGGEVTLLDMTSAYGVFANEGARTEQNGILRIEDSAGEVLFEYEPNPVKVLDRNVALTISDMLADNEARTPAFGANSPLYFPNRAVAAKTGTTNDFRDAWILGYTPNLAVGAWAGNNDNSSMEKKVAGFTVAPLWNEFMRVALATREPKTFPPPSIDRDPSLKPVLRGKWRGNQSVFIDSISGKRATEHTPEETREELIIPNIHSILHWVDRDDPRGPIPQNPGQDSQYSRWEAGVERWKRQNNIGEDPPTIPDEFDDIHGPDKGPTVSITTPTARESFARDATIRSEISVTPKQYGIRDVQYYVDGNFVGSVNREPYAFSFSPRDMNLSPGSHTLRVMVKDVVYNSATAEVSFSIK